MAASNRIYDAILEKIVDSNKVFDSLVELIRNRQMAEIADCLKSIDMHGSEELVAENADMKTRMEKMEEKIEQLSAGQEAAVRMKAKYDRLRMKYEQLKNVPENINGSGQRADVRSVEDANAQGGARMDGQRNTARRYSHGPYKRSTTVLNQMARRHVCLTCNKSFRASTALLVHHRVHTGERPFECEICGRKFSTQGNLNAHNRHVACHG